MGIFDNGLVQQPNTMLPGWGARQPWQGQPNPANGSTVSAGMNQQQPGATPGAMPPGFHGEPYPLQPGQNTNMPLVGPQAGQQNTNMGMANLPPPVQPPSPTGPAPGQVGNGFNTGVIGPRPVAPQPHPVAPQPAPAYHGTNWGTGPAPMAPQAPPGVYHPNLPQQPSAGVSASSPPPSPYTNGLVPQPGPKPPAQIAPQPAPVAPQPAQYGGLSQQDFQARNRALMAGRGPTTINGIGIGR